MKLVVNKDTRLAEMRASKVVTYSEFLRGLHKVNQLEKFTEAMASEDVPLIDRLLMQEARTLSRPDPLVLAWQGYLHLSDQDLDTIFGIE